ncbi:MAG: ATP-binding protein [Proteobacteria bacterium]|nr:ATP-binding protein [Pseudomonadota bacterium]
MERSALFAELKQQRDRLQRLELQKEQLVAFLVHDLKNPVHAIDLYAQIVKRAADDPDRVRVAASKISEEAHALVRMITNLLDISRADEAQLAPTRCEVDLSELVERARGELAVRAEATSVRLDMSLPPTRVLVDPDLISRVVVNLVDNAIRHAPEASIVRTTAIRQGDHVEIRIADSGPGIPSDQRTTVFERFQRSGDHATRSNRGLGLAFCKLAVEAHGGTIWVEDGAPGAVFCVRLPDVRA